MPLIPDPCPLLSTRADVACGVEEGAAGGCAENLPPAARVAVADEGEGELADVRDVGVGKGHLEVENPAVRRLFDLDGGVVLPVPVPARPLRFRRRDASVMRDEEVEGLLRLFALREEEFEAVA